MDITPFWQSTNGPLKGLHAHKTLLYRLIFTRVLIDWKQLALFFFTLFQMTYHAHLPCPVSADGITNHLSVFSGSATLEGIFVANVD